MAALLLKKILSVLIYPLSICAILIIPGVILLWFPRRQKLGRILVTVAVGLMMLIDFRPFADFFVESLEQRYPHILTTADIPSPETVKWVVVLGAGSFIDPKVSPNLQLHPVALARLVEGIRLYRLLPGSKLILSAGAVFGKTPNAELQRKAALLLGVPPEDMILESQSADTADEAAMLRSTLGHDRFLLVTSAVHMPRSMGLFLKQGLTPIAAPADESSKPGGGIGFFDFVPGAYALGEVEKAYHEYVGIMWARLRGQM